MERKEALQQLNLGQSVAEFDEDLKRYFVETDAFRSLIHGRADIVAGDKGTGKSALFRILRDRYAEIKELNQVEVLPAFNASGDPIFKQLTEGDPLNEGQYRTVWKTYVLSLASNWLLKIYDGQWTPSMVRLDFLLTRIGLRDADETPSGVFSKLVALIRRLVTPKRAGTEFSLNESGIPVIGPYVEFGDPEPADSSPLVVIRHAESLGLLNASLEEASISLWLVLDRLDEAFAGYPSTEVPALKALFRTYLDLQEFDRIKLKMFVRKDLFRKVTEGEGGFVNLSHINDKKVEIVWDDDDLLNLLIQRVRINTEFMQTARLEGKTNTELFNTLFPPKVQEGAKRPGTFKWMLTRIRDGQDVKPPRNLIDLVKFSQQEQLRREGRDPKNYAPGDVLIEGAAIKDGLNRLSTQRVVDTLLAESGDYKPFIEKFRDGKAEHNLESLQAYLGVNPSATRGMLRIFIDMGFLERIGETYKIPMLYREGLNISQGKAFQVPAGEEQEDDEDEDV